MACWDSIMTLDKLILKWGKDKKVIAYVTLKIKGGKKIVTSLEKLKKHKVQKVFVPTEPTFWLVDGDERIVSGVNYIISSQ